MTERIRRRRAVYNKEAWHKLNCMKKLASEGYYKDKQNKDIIELDKNGFAIMKLTIYKNTDSEGILL